MRINNYKTEQYQESPPFRQKNATLFKNGVAFFVFYKQGMLAEHFSQTEMPA